MTDDALRADILARAVAADDVYESVRARREALPPTWGPFLFHQTVGEIHTVTYYESRTKADVFYFSAGALAPSPWFNLGTCVAGLAEAAKRVRRGEPIYATRLCAKAVHHLLAVDDLLSRRAPFGSSKRERRAPGPLTELARSSLAAPSPADAAAYFTALAAEA